MLVKASGITSALVREGPPVRESASVNTPIVNTPKATLSFISRWLIWPFLAFFAIQASAGPITPTINYVTGTQYNTTAPVQAFVSGGDMAGMLVTAFFTTGASQTLSWAQSGPSWSGGVVGTGWSAQFSGLNTLGSGTAPNFGDELNNFWLVKNTNAPTINKIVFDGAPGRISFDVGGVPVKSPGSLLGQAISYLDAPGSAIATYKNKLWVTGTAYNDEWTLMELATNLPKGQQLYFAADTDKATTALTVVPSIPEPKYAVAALIGIPLGLYWVKRRKIKT